MAAAYIGSSGTLVSAALQTIGYHYQSFILNSFGAAIAGPIGVLIFIVCAIIAIVNLLLTGKPRMVLWFVLGPSLLLAVLQVRTETLGVAWKFGNQDRDQVKVDQSVAYQMRTVGDDNPDLKKTPNVSSLFASYDRIISSFLQQVTKIIESTQSHIDSGFILRRQLLAMAHTPKNESPQLKSLIQQVLLNRCQDLIRDAHDVEEARVSNKTPSTINDLQRNFLIAHNQPADPLPENALALVAAIGVTDSEVADLAMATTSGSLPSGGSITGTFNNTKAIADKLEGRRKEAVESCTNSTDEGVNCELKTGEPVPAEEMSETERASFDAQMQSAKEKYRHLTCGQVWNFTYIGLWKEAVKHQTVIQNRGVDAGMPADDLVKDLLLVRDPKTNYGAEDNQVDVASLNALTRVIANYIMKDEISESRTGKYISGYVSRNSPYQTLVAPGESDMAVIERDRLKVSEWEGKSGIINTATTLPYYQGLGLYFLAISFPFFALLLVIPGKHASFIMWFLLWLWLKSWDLGFAVVMLLDSVLYTTMKQFTTVDDAAKTLGVNPDIDQTVYNLTALHNLDPTHSLGLYYSIIGTALSSVPMIMSYIVLASVKGGSGLISEGVSSYSSQIAGRVKTASGQAYIDAARVAGLRREQDTVKDALDEYMGFGGDGRHLADAMPSSPIKSTSFLSDGAAADHRFDTDADSPGGAGRAPGTNARPTGVGPTIGGATFGSGAQNVEGQVVGATAGGLAAGVKAGVGSPNYNILAGRAIPSLLEGSSQSRSMIKDIAGYGEGVLKNWSDVTSQYAGAKNAWFKSAFEKDLKTQETVYIARSFAGDYIKTKSAAAVVFGAIQIPWAGKDAGYKEDMDADRNNFFKSREYQAAVWSSIKSVIDNVNIKDWESAKKSLPGALAGLATTLSYKDQKAGEVLSQLTRLFNEAMDRLGEQGFGGKQNQSAATGGAAASKE